MTPDGESESAPTAVVIVTYSAPRTRLDRVIAAVRAAGGCDSIIVVDTGGAARPGDPDVDLVSMANRGYGAAANVGFERAIAGGARSIALLNDDVTVRAGWLDRLSAELGGEVGVVQPKLVLAGTEPPVVNSLGVSLDEYGQGVDIGDGEIDGDEIDGHEVCEPTDIEMFTGGAVLMSAAFVVATGGFDERYFLYYEDVDLALRGAELGWRYRLVPGAVVEHERGSSTAARPDRTRRLQERNRLWVAARFGSTRRYAWAVWLSVRRLRHRPRLVHARALVEGLAGTPRRALERRRRPRR